MNTVIAVATHKDYPIPLQKAYMPVQAGRALNKPTAPESLEKGITYLTQCRGDDEGDNISAKNQNYCELTVLYWLWKNVDSDYKGLVHYRRFFRDKSGILTAAKAEKLLEKYDAILPRKRSYFIETTYNQYIHAHNKQDLDVTREIIVQYYPGYLPAWEKAMNSTEGHRFNMLVMSSSVMDSYCAWLFDILFKLEQRLDISGYSANDQRVFGFVAERLLDVWLIAENKTYTELPVLHLEGQNWPKKIVNFIIRMLKK